MTIKDKIFLESKAWAEEKMSLDPKYFTKLDNLLPPHMLWIGSSDNLVSVRETTNTEPGEILVYRNIASQVRQDDVGMMAMIEDAVAVQHIRYIIVCGYSHCSGVRKVLDGTDEGPHMRQWLQPIRELCEQHRDELDELSLPQQERRLSELNIELQIHKLSQLPCVQRSWDKNDYPQLFGWYFDLPTGTLKEVFSMEHNRKMKKVESLVTAFS